MGKQAQRTQFEPNTVYAIDIRNAGLWYCANGSKTFFERHGLSFRDFLNNGIGFDALEKTGDAMALKAIDQAKKRQGE